MHISKWQEEGKKANIPFYVRWNPPAFRIPLDQLRDKHIIVPTDISEKFVTATLETMAHYGASSYEKEGLMAASKDVYNIRRMAKGMYIVMAIEGRMMAVSYIAWMMVEVSDNGGDEHA